MKPFAHIVNFYTQALLDDQSAAYAQAHGGRSYLTDLLQAHRAAGLLRGVWVAADGATEGRNGGAGTIGEAGSSTSRRSSGTSSGHHGHRQVWNWCVTQTRTVWRVLILVL
jgi:hypothetical protein